MKKKKNKEQRKNIRYMITKFAPKREVTTKNGKVYVKKAKIQRLITPERLRRKRVLKAIKKERREQTEKEKKNYENLIKALHGTKSKKEKKKKDN